MASKVRASAFLLLLVTRQGGVGIDKHVQDQEQEKEIRTKLTRDQLKAQIKCKSDFLVSWFSAGFWLLGFCPSV